jgi:pyruvate kinase
MDQKCQQFERRTKIIATLGPATDEPGVLEDIIKAGTNVVRLNFSHGKAQDHQKRVLQVREIAERLNCVVGILADLQGPKIRISCFKQKKILLKKGDFFTLDASLPTDAGTEEVVSVDYKELPHDVNEEDILLLDDGRITLKVISVKGPCIRCQVVIGGVLSDHKGINRKGGGLTAKALTEKDKEDLKCAVKIGVDYIAISFPRNADDILEAKALIEQENGSVGVIAKIERSEAVEELDAIIAASDGVMVARGDLAVEIGDAEVPSTQKYIIRRSIDLDKPVIIATQMLESMIHSSVPTRAEVSDVANAVLDNADAVMLSAETAAGEYPVEAVEAMSRVCIVAERQWKYQTTSHRADRRFKRIDEAIAMATMYTANHFNIKAIAALTESGATPLWMSRIRTTMPIYGMSRFKRTLGKMSLYRGVYPIEFDATQYTRDEVNPAVISTLQNQGILKDGDKVIMTKGDHMGVGGGSNALKIVEVGKVL